MNNNIKHPSKADGPIMYVEKATTSTSVIGPPMQVKDDYLLIFKKDFAQVIFKKQFLFNLPIANVPKKKQSNTRCASLAQMLTS